MKNSSLFVCMLVLLTGCLKTRADLRAENQDPTPQKVTVAQQQVQRGSSAPAAAPAKPVPTATRFEEIEDQLRQLNGRVDVAENSVSQLAAQKQGESANAGKDRQAMDAKFVAYEQALKNLENQVAALNEEVAKLKAPPPAPAPAPVAVSGGGSAKRTPYDEGEAYFNNKKWKDAIDAYQKYRDTYPKGKSFADATYKIGASFSELGMKDEARLFFEEVKEKFPGSKEAKKAAIRLKSK